MQIVYFKTQGKIKNNEFSWDKTFKYMKKCNIKSFKIFMGSTDKKSIEKLTKLFQTKMS